MHIPARMLSREDAVDNRRVQRMRAADTAANRVQRIYDISRYGCQIESNDLADGASGQFVEIDFGSVVTRAIIRWSDRARLGVEFARPLGSREVDALLAEPAPIRLRRL
jgi:hypothetical protein